MTTGKTHNLAKQRFAKTWDNVRGALGREIVVYLPDIRRECPNCYYDKVHDKSSGIPKVLPDSPNYFTVGRCPVCKGKGVLVSVRKKCIHGMITWNPQGNSTNNLTFNEGGFAGETIVEIKTDECYLDLLKEAKYILVDGVKCKLSNPPIIRGLGLKNVLVGYFVTVDKAKQDSGEYV
jgi:hypothetical protein